MTWKRFSELCKRWIPAPRIVHPHPMHRFHARTQGKEPDALAAHVRIRGGVAGNGYSYRNPFIGLVWRRAVPTPYIRDPHKDEKMAVIRKALNECSAESPCFYEDGVDTHLDPKIGADC